MVLEKKVCIEEISDAFAQLKGSLHTVDISERLRGQMQKEITPLNVTVFSDAKCRGKQ